MKIKMNSVTSYYRLVEDVILAMMVYAINVGL